MQIMQAHLLLPPPQYVSFEDIKEMFRETDRKFQETDSKFQETREQMKETDRRMKELQKTVGRVTNTLGDVVEGFMTSDIHLLFDKYGYKFSETSHNKVFRDRDGKTFLAEADAYLENGNYIMLVEVKSKLRFEDISDHTERMQIVRGQLDLRGDKRKLLGAMASPQISDSLMASVLKAGFYAIIPSENDVKVYPEPSDSKLNVW
jgi:hypothetical protein